MKGPCKGNYILNFTNARGEIMKIYWWQDGVHVKPETEEEREALLVMTKNLDITNLIDEVPTSPVVTVDRNDQYPVI